MIYFKSYGEFLKDFMFGSNFISFVFCKDFLVRVCKMKWNSGSRGVWEIRWGIFSNLGERWFCFYKINEDEYGREMVGFNNNLKVLYVWEWER